MADSRHIELKSKWNIWENDDIDEKQKQILSSSGFEPGSYW